MSAGGLVLAGGQGRRMGQVDKALTNLCGKPILCYILEALRDQVTSVAISANGDITRFKRYGLPVVTDGQFAEHGPLAGILAGLEWAATTKTEVLLSVPCDTPFLPKDLVPRLLPAPSCAASAGKTHHVIALWPVEIRGRLRQFLADGRSRRVRDFSALIGQRVVPFENSPKDWFLNINTLNDLEKAKMAVSADGCARGNLASE